MKISFQAVDVWYLFALLKANRKTIEYVIMIQKLNKNKIQTC